ncbi:MAG: DNA-directed RNA polymerase subunit alpha [Elusimicrobiales bacterium]|nr:DNA-directed RNA polymerase subunit alpha [Elusimicrobiales bacterium]
MANLIKEIIIPKKVEMIEENKNENEHYAKFIAEPYEKGYGHTIGNSLRRVLLSSIDGAAVVAVKIEGVTHEYTTIEGIKEDVLEIVMNLKRLRLRLINTDRQTLRLHAKGKKVVKASDIEPNANVEIINKNLEIANLESGAKLDMEIEVARGVGYVTSDKIREYINFPQNYILMDALFSPVKKVNYKVENARVGQDTDYDRLIIELWTDGTITPKEALDTAGALLKYSVTPFTSSDEVAEKDVEEEVENDDELKELLEQSIEVLELSQRALNGLKRAEIKTIGELVSKTEEDLMAIKNFGDKSLEEIKEKLKEIGLSLGYKK